MQYRVWVKEDEGGEYALLSSCDVIAPAFMEVDEVRNLWERQYNVEVVKVEKIEVKGVMEYPDVIEVTVEKIEEAKGKDVYGDKAGESAEQTFFLVYLKNDKYGIKFHEPIRDSRTPDGFVPERSKLGKWIKLYGVPEVGQVVKAIKDAKGYYRVKLI